MQARIATQAEPFLRQSQYGFRSQRGTRHPLFAVRRAMEWSEMTGNPLYMLFLDWKQAFDSIDHTAMIEALDRFGLSDRMLLAIMSSDHTAAPIHPDRLGTPRGRVRHAP